ncbi:MAG TPA: hypothetical protein PLY86_20085 [bacterium]|nr:hypothetical protein [bacterium]
MVIIEENGIKVEAASMAEARREYRKVKKEKEAAEARAQESRLVAYTLAQANGFRLIESGYHRKYDRKNSYFSEIVRVKDGQFRVDVTTCFEIGEHTGVMTFYRGVEIQAVLEAKNSDILGVIVLDHGKEYVYAVAAYHGETASVQVLTPIKE